MQVDDELDDLFRAIIIMLNASHLPSPIKSGDTWRDMATSLSKGFASTRLVWASGTGEEYETELKYYADMIGVT